MSRTLTSILGVLASPSEIRRQMRGFARLARTSDETLAAQGVTRPGEIRRIMGLPLGA